MFKCLLFCVWNGGNDMEGVKEFMFALNSDALVEDEPQEVVVNGNIILLTRIDGKVYAVDGICTHGYAELVDGDLDGHCLTCPLHFACFDVRDGKVLEGPADIPLKTYDVEEKDGGIWVNL